MKAEYKNELWKNRRKGGVEGGGRQLKGQGQAAGMVVGSKARNSARSGACCKAKSKAARHRYVYEAQPVRRRQAKIKVFCRLAERNARQ